MRTLWLCILWFASTGTAMADGEYEINQHCVASGCFVEDAPGWPFEIIEPGSYRLTSNLDVPDGTTGIVIDVDSVRLFPIAPATASS